VPESDESLPGFRLRVHKGRKAGRALPGAERRFIDTAFDNSCELVVAA